MSVRLLHSRFLFIHVSGEIFRIRLSLFLPLFLCFPFDLKHLGVYSIGFKTFESHVALVPLC